MQYPCVQRFCMILLLNILEVWIDMAILTNLLFWQGAVLVTIKTGGFSCGKESLLQEVNTQRETKQELFVGRGGAFRRQNGAFRRAEAELSVGRNGAFRRAEAELSVGRNGAFRRAEAGTAGKQWAAKGPAIGVQEAAGLRNRGTRTDRKRRPQTLQGSDKRESVTGTDIAQWWWLSAGAN